MIETLLAILLGAFGAYLWLQERDGDRETLWNWTFRQWTWVTVLLLYGLFCMIISGVTDPTRLAIATVFLGWYLFDGVGESLRGPDQPAVEFRGVPKLVFNAFGIGPGERMSWPAWLTWSAYRWLLPTFGLATALGNWWLLLTVPVSAFATWPLGHWLWRWRAPRWMSEGPPEYGALIGGFVLFGVLGYAA